MKTSRPGNGSTQTTQTANTQNRQHYLFTPFAKGISLLLFAAAIILSSFAASPQQAKAQEKEHKPCLALYEDVQKEVLKIFYEHRYGKEYDPNDTIFYYNPYKVMLDTCPPITEGNWAGYTYYATHYFRMEFEHNIIPRKEIYEDGRLIYYTIDNILDQYKECKEGLRELEKKYGKFKFVDRETMRADTVFYKGEEGTVNFKRALSIQFDKPANVVEAISALDKIDLIKWPWWESGFLGEFFEASVIVENKPIYDYLEIYPTTANNEITITLSDKDIMFPKEINIYDNTGKLVKMMHTGLEHDQDINISTLPNGYYFVQVGNSIGKFIIAR